MPAQNLLLESPQSLNSGATSSRKLPQDEDFSSHLTAICRMAANLFGVKFASVSSISQAGQIYLGKTGFAAAGTAPGIAFCEFTVKASPHEQLVVLDARKDIRFACNPLVTGNPHLRFYAGTPIIVPGLPFTVTVCVADDLPHEDFDANSQRKLEDLALYVEAIFRSQQTSALVAEAEDNVKKAVDAWKESETRFSTIAKHTSDVFVLSTLDSVRHYVSPALSQILGYEPASWIGTTPKDFIHPEDYNQFREAVRTIRINRSSTVYCRYRHARGQWVWIEVVLSVTFDASGEANGYVATLRDISARRETERALRLSEERLALALDSGDDGLWDWDIGRDAFWMSRRWCVGLSYDPNEFCEKGFKRWRAIPKSDRAALVKEIKEHLSGRSLAFSLEHRMLRADGTELWVHTRGRVVSRDGDGRALRMVGTQMDITRRKDAELQVQHMALHDALTGLPNRILLRDRIEQAIALHKQTGATFSVLACDLDLFKAVNDSLGHNAGDDLLRNVAIRMEKVLAPLDTVARVGGDEFTVVLTHSGRNLQPMQIAQQLIHEVGQAVTVGGKTIRVGMSIGFLTADRVDEDPDELMSRADMALYDAKRAGRNAIRVYQSEAGDRIKTRSTIDLDLREALARGGFYLRFQPVVHVASNKVVSFEALLRWQHPQLGNISPIDFIPVAEASGFINQIGEWVLREACKEAMRWPDNVRVAVNVSANQLQHDNFEAIVISALAYAGLPSRRLKLEVTESVLMQNTEMAIKRLSHLRDLGIAIALDDFGTGYSSLSYLRRLPFDKIKLDRSFVSEIAHPHAAAIVRAVVGIGERLGMIIVAEGVETAEQLDLVRREGCQEVQGFYFSKPLLPDEALVYLASL